MYLWCNHCQAVMTDQPADVDIHRLHVGPGEPHFATSDTVTIIAAHVADKHTPIQHAWLEGRDYKVMD